MWPRAIFLAALAGFAAGALLSGLGAWKWQAGNIADLKADAAERIAKGWESALTVYREDRNKSDAAVTQATTTITGLQAELKKSKADLKAAQRNSPECKAWSDQPIACPF